MPTQHRATADDAARRLLIEPDADIVTPLPDSDAVAVAAVGEVRRAVVGGHRLRLHYAATGQAPRWRTVDPIGLVTVRDRAYLLASRDGADRTYRLSRILSARELPEVARRPDDVDLDQVWRARCAQYLSDVDPVTAVVSTTPARREAVARAAMAVRTGEADTNGRVRLEVTFQDVQHAEWALWQLAEDVEVLEPASLRAHLHDRANAIAARHT